MSQHATIGLDIGGTKTLAALFDESFTVLAKNRFKTEPETGGKAFEKRLSKAIASLVKAAKAEGKIVTGVGVGCAGNIKIDSMELQLSPNVPFLKGFPLREKMERWTGTDVFIGNDVQMGLYGEHRLGAARGGVHVLGVFIGTGIGGAMMINGQLHTGSNGVAGDIGHYLIQPLGPLGGSERQGVLDNVASRTAIAAEAAVLASRQWAPQLWKLAGADLTKIQSKMLARAIKLGDKKIEELVRSRAHIIGIVLSNFVDFINPDTVLLGGGLVDEMPKLVLDGVMSGIEHHSTPAAHKKLKIVVSQLRGLAVATGAAKMAWDLFLEKEKIRPISEKRAKEIK